MHDTGTSSMVYVRYWYYQYCNITILVFLVLYSVTILVIPVSRPAASYYPVFVLSSSCAPYVASFSGLSILECLCSILERLFTCRCFLTNHGYVTFLICHLLFFKLEFHNSHYCTIYFHIYILHFVLSDKRYN